MNSSLVATPLEKKAKTLFLAGWISFWLQLVAVIVTCFSLVFTVTGRQISNESNPALGVGIFFAICGIIAGGFTIFLAFRYARIGKRLLNPNPALHPKKSSTVRLLKIGLYVGLGGILLTLIGSGITSTVLVAKTVSQPPGTTLTDPSHAVRALDVFVMVANLNGILAHYLGTVTSLWLLYRI